MGLGAALTNARSPSIFIVKDGETINGHSTGRSSYRCRRPLQMTFMKTDTLLWDCLWTVQCSS